MGCERVPGPAVAQPAYRGAPERRHGLQMAAESLGYQPSRAGAIRPCPWTLCSRRWRSICSRSLRSRAPSSRSGARSSTDPTPASSSTSGPATSNFCCMCLTRCCGNSLYTVCKVLTCHITWAALDPIRSSLCVKNSLKPGVNQWTKWTISPDRVHR